MRMANTRKLTDDEHAALKAVAAMTDDDIDIDDVPERKNWSGAVRGALYRPVKQSVTMRLDADVVAWFKHHGDSKGYQTRINAALREYIAAHEQQL